ncbi:uncharacterized protein KY384_002751 [Bacidia gigantensis]|uniref:uncharacterized protein n=1 Tax=Bacidia gigantensis TaxID=2732470 RepID=UPI001D05BCF1|nr:uncharacterized protein KY384_002751 [Bacidia gigantensis]KAG8532873.1 hypothetical protein KY384_002751 [Bacidia gigantensis]
MPEFLELVFLFGKQTTAEDLYFSDFRHSSRVTALDRGMQVPERLWSGYDLQMCYSLKSVESSSSQPDWPWSIRNCILFHSFDLEQIRSTWIVIKGNQDVKQRIQAATRDCPKRFAAFETIDRAFAQTLSIHLLLCEWSAENWRWYIKFLEKKLEALTEATMFINADVPISPMRGTEVLMKLPRTDTQKSQITQRSRMLSFPRSLHSRAPTNDNIQLDSIKENTSNRMYTNSAGIQQPRPPGRRSTAPQDPKTTTRSFDVWGQQRFFFRDLQDTQKLEESANEVVLVLNLNVNVMSQLKKYYESVFESHEMLDQLRTKCKEDVSKFDRELERIVNSLYLQILRVEALQRLLKDRKTLVSPNEIDKMHPTSANKVKLYGLLEFENTRANEFLAWQSRDSNKNMELMTKDMGILARKTKTETVSMKIITLVTLFFLPGTFISI